MPWMASSQWAHCSLYNLCLEIPFLGWVTPPKRGVSVNCCHDNAAKQATLKFPAYKSKHLFILLMCLSAGPRFADSFHGLRSFPLFSIFSLKNQLSVECSSHNKWQVQNCENMFKASAHIISCLFTFQLAKTISAGEAQGQWGKKIYSAFRRKVTEYLLNNLPICHRELGWGFNI